jgi:aspartate racemase
LRSLGLIGGLSWVSTALYYDAINRGVAKRLGGLSSARLLIESHDFASIAALQREGDWDGLAEIMAQSAARLHGAGAEGLLICSNTMHKLFDAVAAAVPIPVLHIADITARQLQRDGVRRVGLLGTRFTMDEAFLRDRIASHGIDVVVPDPGMRAELNRIIFEELARGQVTRGAQRTLKSCIAALAQARCEAAILGCTELVMLTDSSANMIPVHDTTALHSAAAVDWMLVSQTVDGETAREAA